MKRIKNGGIELGIMQFVESQGVKLSEEDRNRKEYLESLPKGVDVYLDENGMQISKEEYTKKLTRNL